MEHFECKRCEDRIPFEHDHTEIVRRNFRDRPRPAIVEHLCRDCWQAYVEDFLGQPWLEAESTPVGDAS